MKNTVGKEGGTHYEARIIVNPASRSGLKVYKALLPSLGELFHYDVRFTESRGHAEELARSSGGDVIIVCGGDGTINEIANGLAGRIDVAVAPTFGGSGCDLSRLLGIKKPAGERLREIYDKLRAGERLKMRLSVVETGKSSRFFVGVGDAGFGAEVAGLFDGFRRFGKMGYVLGVLKALVRMKPVRVEILIDGKLKSDRAMMVMFARSRYYAGGMKVSPNSDHLSDSARFIYLKWMRKLKFLFVFPLVFAGRHIRLKQVEEGGVNILQIKTPGLPIDVEGEFVGLTPCTFAVTGNYISFV